MTIDKETLKLAADRVQAHARKEQELASLARRQGDMQAGSVHGEIHVALTKAAIELYKLADPQYGNGHIKLS